MRHSALACPLLLGLACSSSSPGDVLPDGSAGGGDMSLPPPLTGSYACARAFAGSSAGAAYRAAVDAAGDIVVLGLLSGSGDLGGGAVTTSKPQPFLAKYGPACEYRWAQLIDAGASGQVTITNFYPIAVGASGNVFTVMSFSGTVSLGGTVLTSANGGAGSDLLLLTHSSAGSLLAARRLGGPGGGAVVRLAVAADGGLLVAGQVVGAADFGSGTLAARGKTDLFVAKYSETGSPQWSRLYGTAADDLGVSLAAGRDGSVFLLGSLGSGSADLGGGAFTTSSRGDWFLAKYGADGSYKWSRHAPAPTGYLGLTAIAAAPDGSVVLAGDAGGVDDLGGGAQGPSHGVVVVRYAGSGDYVTEKRFAITPSSGAVSARGLAIDESGHLSLGGEAQSAVVDFGGGPLTRSGATDGYLVKLRPDLGHVWGQRASSATGPLFAYDAATGPKGQAALVGTFVSDVDVGGHSLSGTPNKQSGFLARFLP